jgi:rRNA processing protein Krr1/Pno1
MTDPVTLRDSTQIVLARGALDGTREAIEAEFTVSVHGTGTSVRIIGSPVEIKAVTRFLARCGVPLP